MTRSKSLMAVCVVLCSVAMGARSQEASGARSDRTRGEVPACTDLEWGSSGNVLQDYYAPIDTHFKELVEKAHVYGDKGFERTWLNGNQSEVWGNLYYTLRKMPNHPWALRRLVAIHDRYPSVSLDDVKRRFECAVQWNPKIANTHLLYAMHLQLNGRTEDAVERYKKALELQPDHAEAHYNIGLAYLKLGDVASAEKHAQAAYAEGHPLPGLRNAIARARGQR
jgi:tetratricopeptide (TPR) repeat protein